MATIINADTSDGLKLTSDTSGEIELQSGGVTQAKITSSGLQNASGSAIIPQAGKNIIINGDMNIAQRATSVTGITTGNIYRTVDRWRSDVVTSGTWTQTQDTDVPLGQGFAASLKMDCTTADTSVGANDRILIGTRFEGFNVQTLEKGTSATKSITLSFWVKSNKTGTYIVELFDSPNSRQIAKSYTISVADTWEKKTITYAGDTSGVFANSSSLTLLIQFWFAAGSNYTSGTLNTSWTANTNANRAVGQVNLADSTANYINITGAQLEVGTVATPFEHLQYGQQLALCQRYYEKSYNQSTVPATAEIAGAASSVSSSSAPTQGNGVTFKVTKRAAPTMAVYNGVTGAVGYSYRVSDAASVATTFSHMGEHAAAYINIPSSANGYYFHFTAESEL